MSDSQIIDCLYLWKQLIKDGCEWHGDIHSSVYSEELFVPEGVEMHARSTLETYEEGVHYKWSTRGTILIM